jgi:hypothetical protein
MRSWTNLVNHLQTFRRLLLRLMFVAAFANFLSAQNNYVATLLRIPPRVKPFCGRPSRHDPRRAAWSVKLAFLRHVRQPNAAELGVFRPRLPRAGITL